MSNLINIQRKISEGVSGWLLFEFHCFRGTIFNEKYLSYPVSQILNSLTEFKTLTEINHPLGNNSVGRPLQVDFVLADKSSNWKFAFETKWVGNSEISIGSMVWDLVRLQNLFSKHKDIECYFILSGFDKKINSLLDTFDIVYDKNSVKANGLTSINQTYMKFNLTKLDTSSKAYINKQILKYPNFTLFSKIHCRPAHSFPKIDIINMTFRTYIFEILKPDETLKVKTL